MSHPLHDRPNPSAAGRTVEVVRAPPAPCELCGVPAVERIHHWSGLVSDACAKCATRFRTLKGEP